MWELVRVFLLVLGAVTVLMVFVGVFREASDHGLGVVQIMQILPFVVPSLLPFTIPATMLLTVAAVYGRMSGDNEIIAAKAAGINVLSIIAPSLVMGVVLSAGALFMTDRIIPWASKQITTVVVNALEVIFLERLHTDLQHVDRKNGVAITVSDVQGNKLIKPTFSYRPKGKSTVTIQAEEAELDFDMKNQQVLLHISHSLVDAPNGQKMWIEDGVFPIPLPGELKKINPGDMTIQSIGAELEKIKVTKEQTQEQQAIETAFALTLGEFHRLEESEFEHIHWKHEKNHTTMHRLKTEEHSRIALAFSCLAFVWVGSPFSIMRGERQFLKSFFMCFVPIILVYYPLMLLIINQSRVGVFDPSWMIWVPNGLMFVAGCYFFHRVRQH
jgi:lipopolysaccharide export system permease protein